MEKGCEGKLNIPCILKNQGTTEALGIQERPLYVVTYEARPLEASDNLVSYVGAMVNVWVVASTEQQAMALASQQVQEAGWRIEALDAVFAVTRDDYAQDDASLQHFEQALVDGIVLVFHTWQEGTQH